MKNLLSSLLLLTALLSLAASTGPTYTQDYFYVFRVQTDPSYNGSATATAAPVNAFFNGHFVNDADPTDTHEIAIGAANFDLLAPPWSTQTVTAGGITATGAQIYGLLNAFATAQYNTQQATAKAAKAAANP